MLIREDAIQVLAVYEVKVRAFENEVIVELREVLAKEQVHVPRLVHDVVGYGVFWGRIQVCAHHHHLHRYEYRRTYVHRQQKPRIEHQLLKPRNKRRISHHQYYSPTIYNEKRETENFHHIGT
jgi:hypothetical protein